MNILCMDVIAGSQKLICGLENESITSRAKYLVVHYGLSKDQHPAMLDQDQHGHGGDNGGAS
eukprot:CAMPEP_0116879154 /NCGR_PEP_ID=MMETSP0463-20121206/10914_1 /TAXON_ID=181622 /ORGANISM="Strombidinopsis sp, Strain SopsisLIS2011" /LENGTH=61 /DNA_ID=CAMNT_0004528111 /DNA_START=786 /DNA_END=971 /DNA_ORIENTATION=-